MHRLHRESGEERPEAGGIRLLLPVLHGGSGMNNTGGAHNFSNLLQQDRLQQMAICCKRREV